MAKNLHAKSFGKWGEEKATNYYQQLGFEIIARNVHTPYGEIDLVVKDQTGIIFVEVKTRSSMSFGYPEESITKLKQDHMIKSADAFLQKHPEFEDHWTIDVLSIQKLTGTNEIYFERFENAIKIKMENPLIVVVGPTAVGKTEFSIQLAEKINGEIISADSRTFYKGMDIGTAKPTHEQLIQVPHHLIDVLEPRETWSLALFQKEVHQIILEVHRRGKVPIMVGGTGQYIRAVLEGWSLPNVPPNGDLRAALNLWAEQIGRDGLHQRLLLIDPSAANKIEPENLRRTVRAFEVIFSTGRRFSDQYLKNDIEYPFIILGLTRDREDLYHRIDSRIDEMVKSGFIEEVRGLLDQGNPSGLSAFSAIGYPQIIRYLQEEISLPEAIELIKKNSREFVRRQSNWFKVSDEKIYWLNASDKNLMKNASKLIGNPAKWILPKGTK